MVIHLPDSWLNGNLEMLVFEKRGKLEYSEKNLSEQRREPTMVLLVSLCFYELPLYKTGSKMSANKISDGGLGDFMTFLS